MPSDKVWECVFCKHSRLRREADAAQVPKRPTEVAGESPDVSVNGQHVALTKGSGASQSSVAIGDNEARKRRKRRSGRTICHRGCGRPPHRGSCPRRPVDVPSPSRSTCRPKQQHSQSEGQRTGPVPKRKITQCPADNRKRRRATRKSTEPRICHRGCVTAASNATQYRS